MTTMRITGGLGLLVGIGLAAGPALALEGDPSRGESVAGTCVACHQADGMGMNMPQGESWPRLAGLPADYIAKQLHDFQAGRRENATMMPFAKMLDDQQIADVAAYYAGLASWPELPTAYSAASPDQPGEWLAERGDWDKTLPACSQCHGPNGQGVGADFPPIAGQHAGYLSAQLRAWRNGDRHNDPDGLMRGIAERLDDDQIDLIADYYATLPERLEATSASAAEEEGGQ
ncbi:c-type cytochrome [Halomonas nitroreducens]|uniref:Cytochrome c4 n=1 Tax=Halomonas nitroreducens TaxID=447425 RepID=A0A3S0KTU6_9GAMM|nr:c-type cytochrome [Halomonas nitroreducens]RTR07177.1 cytochrome c4 [Halomonas nitroreducens]